MALTPFTSGINTNFSSELNSNFIQNHQKAFSDASLIGKNEFALNSASRPVSLNLSSYLTLYNLFIINDASYSVETDFVYTNQSITSALSIWDYEILSNIRTTSLSASSGTDGTHRSADTNDISGKKVILIRYSTSMQGNSGSSSGTASINLYDGTNRVAIMSRGQGGDNGRHSKGYIRLFIDETNDEVSYIDYYNDNTTDLDSGTVYISPKSNQHGRGVVDISTLTLSTLYVESEVVITNCSCTMTVEKIYEPSTSPSTTVTESISLDNGSTYTSGGPSYSGLTSGDQVVAKLEANVPSDETLMLTSNNVVPS